MTMKWIRRASCALTLGLMVLASGGVAQAQTQKYDEIIQRMLKEGRSDLPVIVRYKDNASKERNRKAFKGQRSRELRREMRKLRAMGLRTNRAALLSMLADSGVSRVS